MTPCHTFAIVIGSTVGLHLSLFLSLVLRLHQSDGGYPAGVQLFYCGHVLIKLHCDLQLMHVTVFLELASLLHEAGLCSQKLQVGLVVL